MGWFDNRMANASAGLNAIRRSRDEASNDTVRTMQINQAQQAQDMDGIINRINNLGQGLQAISDAKAQKELQAKLDKAYADGFYRNASGEDISPEEMKARIAGAKDRMTTLIPGGGVLGQIDNSNGKVDFISPYGNGLNALKGRNGSGSGNKEKILRGPSVFPNQLEDPEIRSIAHTYGFDYDKDKNIYYLDADAYPKYNDYLRKKGMRQEIKQANTQQIPFKDNKKAKELQNLYKTKRMELYQ